MGSILHYALGINILLLIECSTFVTEEMNAAEFMALMWKRLDTDIQNYTNLPF